MQTRDHLALGHFLLNRAESAELQKHRRAFLLGCIEPDLNLTTYLRGLRTCRNLRGHNAENSARHVENRMAALRSRGLRTPWDYFALGTMLHYVADAFTLPHNAFGDRDLVRHAVYETELHPVFSGALLRERDPAERTEPRLLPALFAARRRDYGAAPRRMETDCRYIIGVCEQVLRGSLRCAAPAFAAGRESGGARPCEAPCRCGTL